MNLISRLGTTAVAAVAILLSAITAKATPITITNASFESPSSPASTSKNPNILPGWVFNVQGGSEYGTMTVHSSSFSSVGASSGNNYAYINNDSPNVTDTLTSAASLGTITPDTDYTLTVAIGNRNGTGLYNDPGNVSFSLLANGVAFATQTVTNGTVPNGTFDDFTLTYTTPDSGSMIGENLTIQLATLPEQSNAFQAGFDNVTLDETTIAAAPEPATVILLVGGLALIGIARLRRGNRAPLAGLAMFSIVAVGMASASADPVDVPNGSFETSSSGGGWTYSNPGTISDWTFDAPTGSAYGQLWLVFFNSPGTSSGSQSAFIDNTSPGEEASLTSAASLGTIAADTTYTLTVAVGNPDLNDPTMEEGPLVFDPVADTPPSGVFLALLANGQPFAIDSIPAGLVASGEWQDFSFSYATTDSDPIDGQQLTIQLGTEPGSAGAASFDNVRLDATSTDVLVSGGTDGGGGLDSTPEPPALALLGFGGLALGSLMRWKRLSSDFVS
jgi:PEP-CTERM motif